MSAYTTLLAAALLQPSEPTEPAPAVEPAESASTTEPSGPTPVPVAQPEPSPPPVAVAVAPTPAPAPAPLAATPAAAPAAATPPPAPESPYERRGLILRAALGLANCLGDFCDDDEQRVKMGAGALFELGYRPIEQISFGVGVNVSTMKIDVDTDPGYSVDARAIMVSPLGFFFVHPVKKSRLDPYAGVGVGWQMHRATFEYDYETSGFEGEGGDSDETIFTLKRGTARLTGGLDVYVSERVALGPRFDLFLGFGGEACLDDGTDEECDDIDDAFDNDDEEELPRNWLLGLNLTATF